MRLSTISSSLSFGITISVSTLSFIFQFPQGALFIRVLDSKRNGFVTTPTVNAPCSFAIRAINWCSTCSGTTAHTAGYLRNTMSAPFSAAGISSALSSAAFSHRSPVLLPAPKTVGNLITDRKVSGLYTAEVPVYLY